MAEVTSELMYELLKRIHSDVSSNSSCTSLRNA